MWTDETSWPKESTEIRRAPLPCLLASIWSVSLSWADSKGISLAWCPASRQWLLAEFALAVLTDTLHSDLPRDTWQSPEHSPPPCPHPWEKRLWHCDVKMEVLQSDTAVLWTKAEWSYDFSAIPGNNYWKRRSACLDVTGCKELSCVLSQCSLSNSKAATHSDSLKICLLITQILHIILNYLANV